MPYTYQGSFRARRLRRMCRPLLPRTILQQEYMVENVSTHNATFFLDQQIPASERALQEQGVQYHDRRTAPAPVKAHQFVPLARQQWHAKLPDGSLGSKVMSAPVSKSNGTSETVTPLRGLRSLTWATGAGGSKCVAS